jgi:CheY-like chemotaxis protein/two-component sensor histidine kinase
VQASGAPLRDSAGRVQGGVIVWTEITRIKEYEHSKDEWLAIAAHELRTPLTPITVHLQMAQRRLHMGRPIGPEVFDRALEQVKRLSRLVNGLLDVTRLQAGQLELLLEDVDLRELAEGIVERVRLGAPRHTFVLDVDPRPAVVRGDRARLDEVISALVDNAVKYSPEGGEVWVRVATRGAEVLVAVRDEGIGIGPDEREQIFERYFRAGSVPHMQYGGLGLGLWIAGKVVQKHGGRIELESERRRGSTFTVVLPRAGAAGAHDAPEITTEEASAARILVVDDDAAVLDAVRGLLAEDGYDARVVNSGEEALLEARVFRPDVVLLDLRMPGMDGWEVRRRFAEDPALARIPIVLVSADRDARARAAGMDVQGFVAKPFDVDELERVVRTLADAGHKRA